MADSDCIVFPDEFEKIRAEVAATNEIDIRQSPEDEAVLPENVIPVLKNRSPGSDNTMADNRIVFPDEYEKMKEAAEKKATERNGIEEPPEEVPVQPVNAITVPGNCPPGQVRGADGVCRDVF